MAVFTFMLMTSICLLLHTTSSQVDSIGPAQSIIRDGETFVSTDGSFELGFFSPGNSNNRYLGIWYKNITVQTVVWVANRCNPISDSSGMLTLSSTGNLVLLYQNESVLWSTKISQQAEKPVVRLLDSGNLVLRDELDPGSFLWQSFDYPSDTWLPGMKLGWDLRKDLQWRLSAWNSWEDPCPGNFTYGFEFGDQQLQRLPEAIIRNDTAIVYRALWEQRINTIYDLSYVYNNDEFYYVYSLKNKSEILRMVINQTTETYDGLIRVKAEQFWKHYASVPLDECDKYGICGANGNCIITEYPMCQCLVGFKPKSREKWNFKDWSDGCVRNNTPSCKHKEKDRFVKFSGMKLPDTSGSWMAEKVNLEECRAICLRDCSCTAYAISNFKVNASSGCINWYDDLIDIRTLYTGGEDLFIRVPHSGKGKDSGKVRAAIVVAPVVGGISGMFLLGYCIFRRGLKGESRNRAKEEDFELPLFSLAAISTATDNFSVSNKLGEGGFGPVYKGKLEDGQEIAVKRLSLNSRQGINELKNEVIVIAKLQHRNLVKLLGCCIQGDEKLLIYEYMPNKSLDFFIFDQQQSKLLKWPKRFEIICGIARGLQYLHQDSRLRIVHRDLKASNILLDNTMNPKISDFGMAKTFGGDQTEGNTNKIAGTHGYMAPEYAFGGLFSIKSDVFSFGVMVLEIISGKRSIHFHHENQSLTLMGHAWTLLNEGRPLELIDKRLRDSNDNLQQVLRCMHIGLLCVQQHPNDRPGMSSVVVMLSSESKLPHPKPPGYFMGTDSQEREYVTRKPGSSSKNSMTITAFDGR